MDKVWIEYEPQMRGAAPADLDPNSPVEYRSGGRGGEWTETDEPGWFETDVYRYMRRPSSVTNSLPEDDAVRNSYPMFDGLLAYFPNALAEVSRVSKIGNDQHNPGQPLHWAREKSTDHENKIVRHLLDVGGIDARGVRHSARLAWRALALLQTELENEEGVPRSRASK